MIILGLRLAFDKAQFGQDVTWIGVQIRIRELSVEATLPADKAADLLAIIISMKRCNVISLKDLRSFAGKCANVATVLYMWRPFLAQLWAALTSVASHAPNGCVWRKQIDTALAWLEAFLTLQEGTISRIFTYEASLGRATPLEMTCDASIYGFGAWLSYQNKPLAWFTGDDSSVDAEVLGHAAGDNTGQQSFEAFTLLVATRTWSHLWRSKRVRLNLRSDNMGALAVFSTLKGAPGAMNLIAREYALDAAQGAYAPDVVSHLPGVTNDIADQLSRKNDPRYAADWSPPAFLAGVPRVVLPARPLSWWRARIAPGSCL